MNLSKNKNSEIVYRKIWISCFFVPTWRNPPWMLRTSTNFAAEAWKNFKISFSRAARRVLYAWARHIVSQSGTKYSNYNQSYFPAFFTTNQIVCCSMLFYGLVLFFVNKWVTDFWTLIYSWSSKRNFKLKVNPMATFEIFLYRLALFNNKKTMDKTIWCQEKI